MNVYLDLNIFLNKFMKMLLFEFEKKGEKNQKVKFIKTDFFMNCNL